MYMNTLKILAAVGFSSLFLLGCNRDSGTGAGGYSETGAASAGGDSTTNAPAATSSERSRSTNDYEPSNTGLNKRDQSGAGLTAEDQGGSEADREISRQVRRAITSNDQLSTGAKNVKVITQNGKVTLRGPVASDEEKQAVAAAAQRVSGVTSVDNQLEVKQNNDNQ